MRLRVTWLDRAYHGREWPPSPLRLYSALVAGVGSACMTDPGMKAALEHLAALDSPSIYAPDVRELHPLASAVPNNDGDIILGYHARGDEAGARHKSSKLRAIRVRCRREIEGDGSITYVWSPHAETAVHLPNLHRLAASLTALGQGIDTAWASLDTDGLRPDGWHWRPDAQGAHRLAVPAAGTLEVLERRYQAERRRIMADGLVHMVPEPQHRQQRYRCELDPPTCRWRLMSLRTPDDRPWSVSGEAAMAVAAMTRHAIHRAALQARLDTETIAALMGHAGAERRLLAAPVPNVGYAHADGRIRRVLLMAPVTLEMSLWEAITDRLVGADLSPPGEDPAAMLVPATQDDRLQHRYIGSATAWTSATPVILPGWDSRGGKRRPLKAVRRLLAFAGIDPALLADVTFEPAPRLRGSMRAAAACLPQHLARWPRVHLSLQWRVSVAGPLALGAGVGYGYGLLMVAP